MSRLATFCVLFLLLAGTTARKEGDLYTEDDPVTILNNSTFDSVIYEQNHGWLVEFYNKWCGHCIRFAPTWIQLGENVKGNNNDRLVLHFSSVCYLPSGMK